MSSIANSRGQGNSAIRNDRIRTREPAEHSRYAALCANSRRDGVSVRWSYSVNDTTMVSSATARQATK